VKACFCFPGLIPLVVAEISTREKQQTWQSISTSGFPLGLFLGTALAHPKVIAKNLL